MGTKCIYATILSTIVATLAFATCAAGTGRHNQRTLHTLQTDSMVRQAVGDSIFTLITQAQRVEVSLVPASQDSLTNHQSIKLDRSEREILNFVLSDIRNFQSDDTVYGKFQPTLRITYKRKKQTCILNFDLGLRKWNICSPNGTEWKRFDLEPYNLLRFTYILFPKDEFINELLKAE